MEKQIYKNSLKSKRNIKEAFIELVAEKDISQIRIREITERAELSKGTFYAHYQDIYAVLEDIENENIERMTAYLAEIHGNSITEGYTPFLKKLFFYIEENKEIYNKLFKSNVAYAFLNKLQKVFVDYMMNDEEILSRLKSKKVAKKFFSFIAVGTASLVQQHFINTDKEDLDEIISSLNNGILYGINSIVF